MLIVPTSGSCQCGTCIYIVNSLPFVTYTCHCRECQKISSSAFNSCMQVAAEDINIIQGIPAISERKTASGNILTTWFCSLCSSTLFSQNSARPRIRTVYIGTLENPEQINITIHIWTKSKLPWINIPESHTIFYEAGDWSEYYKHDIKRYKPLE